MFGRTSWSERVWHIEVHGSLLRLGPRGQKGWKLLRQPFLSCQIIQEVIERRVVDVALKRI